MPAECGPEVMRQGVAAAACDRASTPPIGQLLLDSVIEGDTEDAADLMAEVRSRIPAVELVRH